MSRAVGLVLAVLIGAAATARADGPMNLLDRASVLAPNALAPSSAQVTAAFSDASDAHGLVVTMQPGADPYPGVALKPPAGVWDLSAYGHIEARIVNTSTNPLALSLRVDNAGDWKSSPWSSENLKLKPGATALMKVYFGYSFGKPAFALKPEAVVRLLFFTGKLADLQSFRIESLQACGAAGEKPPQDPKSIRIVPRAGQMLEPGTIVNAATQLVTRGAQASVVTNADGSVGLRLTLAAGKTPPEVQVQPLVGRWDLREALEVRVSLRNDGTTPVTPRVHLESNGGPTAWTPAAAPLAPGAETELVASFIPAVPWTVPAIGPNPATSGKLGVVPGTGTRLTSDAVSAVVVGADAADAERVLTVRAIRAGVPPAPAMPDWVGKRPPVEGEWTLTFDDEFDGTAIDTNRWSVYGDNWYDKITHYSKDNMIVGGGVGRMRYEKKRGFHNDNPAYKQWAPAVTGETDYAVGFLTTYNRWTQRYGYFESRMKLPRAPGLWPAFWLMPDRGPAAGVGSKRGATSGDGMEFDILEWLSRWGDYRYNIAMHWDNYGKEHKSCGTGTIYVQPDQDGWLTAGLLWTPGLAVYYCNGREVMRWEDPRIASAPAHLLYTMPSGGWDNDALDPAKLPADLMIDYVRVWQRKDLAALPPYMVAPTNTTTATK